MTMFDADDDDDVLMMMVLMMIDDNDVLKIMMVSTFIVKVAGMVVGGPHVSNLLVVGPGHNF